MDDNTIYLLGVMGGCAAAGYALATEQWFAFIVALALVVFCLKAGR